MKIKILTLFPEMLRPMLNESILGRAIAAGHIAVDVVNIRDYTANKHRNTDDYPFGGGAGMVMYAQPIVDAIEAHDPDHRARRLYMSPRGRTLTQRVVEELSGEEELLLLCGHYEGVDQRALDLCIDEELSIGDYVLTGGELAALVVIDSVARLVPGVLGSAESGEDESFTTGLLEYPQYTRPAEYRGMRVPEVLLGGNHADIVAWRREKSLEETLRHRPEMLVGAPLTECDRATLEMLKEADEAAVILRKAGADFRRIEAPDAAAYAKKWFATFVPQENRAAAKKQCFSGRRHIGFLWQAFSMGFAPCIEGESAIAALPEHLHGPCTLYLPEKGVVFEIANADALTPDVLAHFRHCHVSGADWTWVRPHKPGVGPYFRDLR